MRSEYHISASSVQAFKSCPNRFRLAYREGLRPIEDTDSQRYGTNWHAMHEYYAKAKAGYVPALGSNTCSDDVALEFVVHLLNDRYSACPNCKTTEEWQVEQQQLLNGFIGYLWYWQDDQYKVLANEVPFELPLTHPEGWPLPLHRVARVGKIDQVIFLKGSVCALERKTTSKSIEPDSDYWDKSKKDTQISMYALAFRDLMIDPNSDLKTVVEREEAVRYGATLYDVFHKPTTKPKMLTQADTAQFIVDGKYMGQEFEIKHPEEGEYWVNGSRATIEPGKKGFAIRETPEMYGARLLQDIQERPEFYFARREIVRTDQEIRAFEKSLYGVYKAQRAFEREDLWYDNESQCRATFACQYIPICYAGGADSVCDGKTTPSGYKRIFVDLTVKGQPIEEE